MATTYNDRVYKVAVTMKYPDKTRFTYSNVLTTADDDKLLDLAEGINDLQTEYYDKVIRTETSVISSETEI